MTRNIFFIFFIWLLTLSSATCFAKNITLYDQPKADAKTVGNIDSDAGIIPIFTPKDNSAWIKVADPRNGNEGWIKNSDLGSGNTSGFTFTQHLISTGKGPGTYQVIQFGNPSVQQMTPEQSKLMLKQIQARQQAIQDDTDRMMRDMFNNMNQQIWTIPMVMPVVYFPDQKHTTKPVTKTDKDAKKSKTAPTTTDKKS